MGGRHSNPFQNFIRIFNPPPPDPCRVDKSVENNNRNYINNLNNKIVILSQNENNKLTEETKSKNLRDDLNEEIVGPLLNIIDTNGTTQESASQPNLEDIKIEIVHVNKEGFCNDYYRDIINGQNNNIRNDNNQINYLNNSIYNHNVNINKYNNESTILKNKINNPLLDVNGKNVSQPNIITKDKFKINENNFNEIHEPNLFYQKNLDLDIPIIENFEPIHYSEKSGLDKKSKAYETLYNNYFNAYQKSINLIQNNLQPSIDELKLTELSGLQYAFTSVKTENDLINQQIQENVNKYSTDNKQFIYQNDNLIYLKSINFVIFILYYCVFLIFLYFMIFVKTTDVKIKIFIAFFFLLFPFIIKPIEEFFYFMITFFISTIFGNVYIINE